jgi:ribosomal protein S27AE
LWFADSQKRFFLLAMEPQMETTKCVRCGSEMLAAGALYGPRRMSFRSEGTKFLTLETGDVMTKASMCRECGLIEITGDVEKLQRLTSET